MKRLIIATACATLLVLSACGSNVTGTGSTQPSQPSVSSQEPAAAESTMAQALAALDGVTSVEPIDTSNSQMYAEKYLVTFEQPLDHKDPAAGTCPKACRPTPLKAGNT